MMHPCVNYISYSMISSVYNYSFCVWIWYVLNIRFLRLLHQRIWRFLMTRTPLHMLMIISLSLMQVKIDQLRQSHQRRICFWLGLASNTGHGGLSKTTKLKLLDSLLQEVCTSPTGHGRSPWVRSGWASAVVRLKLLSSGLKRAHSIDKWILILYCGMTRFPAGLSGSSAPCRVTPADSLIDVFDGYINARGFYIMALDIFWLAGKELHALMIISLSLIEVKIKKIRLSWPKENVFLACMKPIHRLPFPV